MKTRTTLLLSASLFAGIALAQAGPQVQIEAQTGPVTVVSVQPPLPNAADYQVRLVELDQNGDGVVVRGEVPAGHALASEFQLVDSNHDGRITEPELLGWK